MCTLCRRSKLSAKENSGHRMRVESLKTVWMTPHDSGELLGQINNSFVPARSRIEVVFAFWGKGMVVGFSPC
jgi:hypothetical protein